MVTVNTSNPKASVTSTETNSPHGKLTALLNAEQTLLSELTHNTRRIIHKIHKLNKHKTFVQENILKHNHDKIKSFLSNINSESNENHTELAHRVSSPLLSCINNHHSRLIHTQSQNITTLINNTYLRLCNDKKFRDIKHTADIRIMDSIQTMLNCLKHNRNTNQSRANNNEHANGNTENNNHTNTHTEYNHHTCTINQNDNHSNSDTYNHHSNTNTPNNDHSNTNTDDNDNSNHTYNNINTNDDHTDTNNLESPKNCKKPNRKSLKDRKKKTNIPIPHTPDECFNPNCYSCAQSNIVNLSDTPLSKTQIILLNKGLSFIPTANNAKPSEILKDFNLFTSKTKKQFNRLANPPRPERPDDEPALFRKTQSNQTNTNSFNLGPKALEDAFETMRDEIAKLEPHITTKHNLTRKERMTLKDLTTNHNLIINKADKGSTIVVRNKGDYIREGLEHLSDTNTYLELNSDQTNRVTVTIRNTLERMKKSGQISPRMADYCMPPPTPRTALMYFLKKIHKTPMGIRPIVSTVNSATANLAEFLDFYLQPIMKQLPAYIKDTSQFLCEITETTIPKDSWLVTVDVKSLYTNIPNEEGILACYEAWLIQETKDPQHPPAETLRQLLELVLKLNVFEFNGKHYLQKFGTAMGSKLAPAYANTFMGQLEKSILDNSPLKPLYYKRYIDDIFMIWPHSEDELTHFIEHMNQANRSIQFTHEKHQEEIVFLDVVVYKHNKPIEPADTCTLHTKTHVKPTNKQLYVRHDSYHPMGTGKGITVGEAIRYLRTNSDPNNFSKMIMLHKRNLIKRGYSKTSINRHLKKIKFAMRPTLMQKAKEKNNSTIIKKCPVNTKPTFVTRYCPNAKKAFRVVRRHWTSITTDIPILKRFLKNTPRLAYRANTNLAKKLVRAKLKETPVVMPTTNTLTEHPTRTDNETHLIKLAKLKHQIPRFTERGAITQCDDRRCPLHDKLIHSSQVRSRTSRRTYNTHSKANCNTPNVVYMIKCKICNRQYVGQTSQSLKMRVARHLTTIRNRKVPGTLHEHFRAGRSCQGIHNLAVQLLQVITPNRHDDHKTVEEKLKKYETLWMKRLKCEYPQGLNWAEYDPKRRHKK